jgi:hypothetical protein
MKKLILSVTALAACSLGANAQGVIYFDSTGGKVYVPAYNGLVVDTTIDINAELFTGTSPSGVFTPVAELLLSSSNTSPDGVVGFDSSDIVSAAYDIRFGGNGSIQDQTGSPYFLDAAAGTTEYFFVEGWVNGATYLNSPYQGRTAVFSEVPGAATSPILTTLNNMPDLYITGLDEPPLVPEPSSLAMAAAGIGSMLVFGCRKFVRLG